MCTCVSIYECERERAVEEKKKNKIREERGGRDVCALLCSWKPKENAAVDADEEDEDDANDSLMKAVQAMLAI